MENTYGYIRTSRQRIAGEAGSDPEAQALQLRSAGVAPGDIYRDVGVSGSIGTNSRAGWHALNTRLTSGDTQGLSARDRMRRKLRTKRGRERYALRMETVEPVFGQIKQGRGFRQFLLRGLTKVSREWLLICTGHNLLKLFRFEGLCTKSPMPRPF